MSTLLRIDLKFLYKKKKKWPTIETNAGKICLHYTIHFKMKFYSEPLN